MIDSGDCREEAAEASAAVREVTSTPSAATIRSRFHDVQGTAVHIEEAGDDRVRERARAALDADDARRETQLAVDGDRARLTMFFAVFDQPHPGPAFAR